MIDKTQQLSDWVGVQLAHGAKNFDRLSALSGDAGFRRYYRVLPRNDEQPLLAVYAPIDSEDSPAFISIGEAMAKAGLNTPKIIAADCFQGFLLVEDLGETLLQEVINPANADSFYARAMDDLLKLAGAEKNPHIFELYDNKKLMAELKLFNHWFAEKMLAYSFSNEDQQLVDSCFEALVSRALEQPQVLVHRDFHARNLIVGARESLGVIDFQDAVVGPCTYDLVSLLRDCYLDWPHEQVLRWASSYFVELHTNYGLYAENAQAQFIQDFDWMGLQRHIKVLGIFARLSLRDDKHHYLDDLPRVVAYVRYISAKYIELRPFHDWFMRTLMPLIQRQAWYQPYRLNA